MKSLDQWLEAYAVSHQNKANKRIHFVCVPAIFFSIVGLLMSIPTTLLQKTLPFDNVFIENWATIVLIPVIFFYVRLSLSMAVKIAVFSMFCVIANGWIGFYFVGWQVSLSIFIVAWIGQFYGHKIEGKKPSFFEDIQFLLIGPAWILDAVFKKK
ncbi:MAG: DUF962 domain-containing protein [Flavobacteriaceae bacterium]|jgi:uncharacterized membrane protein YGL010W|nr:DUF962 domain-containing protein [Flavobacteriaceae bacterium]MDG2314918.1 DUF962 domain-containing protein [Flavobacteriaceae bacterium]